MQRVCPKCNTLVTGEGSFCPSCGEPLPAAVQLDKAPQTAPMSSDPIPNYGAQQSTPNPGYSAPQPGTIPTSGSSTGNVQYNNNAQFNNNPTPVNDAPMTLGQWVGTIILTTWFGLISLILCIVWGVSADTPINKKRYCQAMIIIQAIGIGVGILLSIILVATLAGIGSSLSDAFAGSSYYYY